MRALAFLLVVTAACGSSSGSPSGGGGGGGAGGIPAGGSGGGGGIACPDNDNDGYPAASCGGTDCDDSDPGVYPGAAEICKDGKDQNCDGKIDEGCECSTGEMRACFMGDPAKRNVGACRDGYQRCAANGTWGTCTGEVDPTTEAATCDGIDQDCDGLDVAACTGCLDHDICGNGLDDDCNGIIDDPTVCTTSCAPAEAPLPDYLACCTDRSLSTYYCSEAPGLPACDSNTRFCLKRQGADPALKCLKHCSADGTCVCGKAGGTLPVQDPDCGFETPCARMDCESRTGQNCYSGPPATLGVGICHAGLSSCTNLSWSTCEGEVVPISEVCGNGTDDDCDGLIDEDDGSGHPCPRTDCTASAEESCDNGFDDDCDGFVDEGCAAQEDQQQCYSGPLATLDRGPCKAGVQQKQADGFWGPCQGEVLPAAERCGDSVDSDCNQRGGPGQSEDAGCCKPAGEETCNGMDDDCDGLVDEGLLNACGGCNTSCGGSITLSDMSSCAKPGRSCVSLVAANGGGFTLDTSIPIVEGTDTGIYFGTVLGLRRFDTATGKTDWDYPFSISATTFYAASADGTIWINDSTVQKLIHLAADGSEKCTYPQPAGMTGRSVAVDEQGIAWALFTGNSNYLYEFKPDSLVGAAGMPKTCVPETLGGASDGLAIDVTNPGFVVAGPPPALWVTGDPGGLRLDRSTLEATKVTMPSGSYLGHPEVNLAGDLWLTLTNGSLAKIPAADDGTHVALFPNVNMLEVNVRSDGTIWGCLATQELATFDPTTGITTQIAPPDGTANERDAVFDYKGRLWMTGIDAASVRSVQSYDPAKQTWIVFTGHDPETIYVDQFCDKSSATQQHFAAYAGSFAQDVDGGGGSVTWTSASWTADVPAGASLVVTIKVSDREDNLGTQHGCGPFTTSPADLSTCNGGTPKGRYLRVQAAMRGGKAVPVLGGVQVDYQLP